MTQLASGTGLAPGWDPADSSLDALTIPPVISQKQLAEQEKQRRESNPGFFKGIGDAVSSQWLFAWEARKLSLRGFAPNLSWQPDEDERAQLVEGLPSHYWPELNKAISPEHALAIREQLLEITARQQRLASMGYVGAALQIGAAMLDPAFIAGAIVAGSLTGGTGAVAVGATRLSRIGNLARTLAPGVVSDIALETRLSYLDPDRGASDIAAAGVSSLAFGAVGHAIGSRIARNRAVQYDKDLEFGERLQIAMGAASPHDPNFTIRDSILEKALSKSDKKYFRNQLDIERRRGDLKHAARALGLQGDDLRRALDDIDAMSSDEILRSYIDDTLERNPHVAASPAPPLKATQLGDTPSAGPDLLPFEPSSSAPRSAPSDTPPSPDFIPPPPKPPEAPKISPGDKRGFAAGDLDLSDVITDAPVVRAAGFVPRLPSVSKWLGLSKAPDVRAAGSAYFDDALIRTDGRGQRTSAMSWAIRQNRARLANLQVEFRSAFSEWFDSVGAAYAKEHKLGRDEMFEVFNQRIGESMNFAPDDPRIGNLDPIMLRARNAARKQLDSVAELANRHGVRGFENIIPADDYFKRVWDSARINRALRVHGSDDLGRTYVHKLVEQAWLDAHPKRSRETAEKVADFLVSMQLAPHKSSAAAIARLLRGDDPEALMQAMREFGRFTEPDIEDFVQLFAKELGDQGKSIINRGKPRIDLNYAAEIMTPAGPLRLADLFDTHAERITADIIRELVGASASQEVYRAMSVRLGRTGQRAITRWEQLRSALEDSMRPENISDAKRIETIEVFEQADRILKGYAVGRNSTFTRLNSAVQSYNFMTKGGGFQMAQISELGNFFEAPFRSIVNTFFPTFRRVTDDVKAGGTMDSRLQRETEILFGAGMDAIAHRISTKRALPDAPFWERASDAALSRAPRKGADALATISGLTAIDSFQRSRATFLSINKLWDYAQSAGSGRLPNNRRLAIMGLDGEQAAKLFKTMRDEAARGNIETVRGPVAGFKVDALQVDKWADQRQASVLIDVAQRMADQTITRTGPGNLPVSFMMHPHLASLFFQFRRFAIASWDGQLLRHIQVRDAETGPAIVGGLMFGGLAYVSLTYTQSLGREDREEFLEERLTPKAIALGAFSRSPFASFLPDLIDTAAAGLTGKTLIGARSSGLGRNFLNPFETNPTTHMINDVWRSVSELAQAATGEDPLTQSDLRALFRLSPWSNFAPVRALTEAFFVSQQPETASNE